MCISPASDRLREFSLRQTQQIVASSLVAVLLLQLALPAMGASYEKTFYADRVDEEARISGGGFARTWAGDTLSVGNVFFKPAGPGGTPKAIGRQYQHATRETKFGSIGVSADDQVIFPTNFTLRKR